MTSNDELLQKMFAHMQKQNLKTEVTVTSTESNTFYRRELVNFLQFLQNDVLREDKPYLKLRSYDQVMGHLDTIIGSANGQSPELIDFINSNDRFHLVKDTGEYPEELYYNMPQLEMTFVREGLYITKGTSNDNFELFDKLAKCSSNSKYNFLIE